jgi:glycine betaine transporter
MSGRIPTGPLGSAVNRQQEIYQACEAVSSEFSAVNTILAAAIILTMSTSVWLVLQWGHVRCEGTEPLPLLTFLAILFTSGLDVGLIMFPLVDFQTYEVGADYGFSNPVAIEFGFWGFLVWGFYFLTTFYFCIVEPRLKLFELPWIKHINNGVIIGTCAFTAYLFLVYLPDYIEGISETLRFGLVATVVLLAVISSTHLRFIKVLSVTSTGLFFTLIAGAWLLSGMGWSGLGGSLVALADYFPNLPRFVLPINDYHAFYLFWWFAWSIMIGQFVSRFVGGIKAWQLLLALLVVPSIPIAVWFSVLYHYHVESIDIVPALSWGMIAVGILFVINSLDSLTRLYTQNINLTVARLGTVRYIGLHWTLLFGLVLLYQFTPFKIEWVGLVVIAIYLTVFYRVWRKRNELTLPQQV